MRHGVRHGEVCSEAIRTAPAAREARRGPRGRVCGLLSGAASLALAVAGTLAAGLAAGLAGGAALGGDTPALAPSLGNGHGTGIETQGFEHNDPAAQPFDYFDGLRFDSAIPSVRDVLGYDMGERFARHADIVRYIEALAKASDRTRLERYGESHQGRSLHALTISSPANLANLDRILRRNRELTEPRRLDEARKREIIATNPAIVWLSYNVHGNEASASNTALQVAYTLAAATNPEVQEILDNTVLVIDPVLNPDGRDRYISFVANATGAGGANPDPIAAEHNEPWPGGRTNHYLFDLNRDWLWMTQPESRARIPMYRRYMPQLHVDYHEQGYMSPYFFGSGDEPFNLNIPEETKEWTRKYGEANAQVFDREGLVYATMERFDYLYPGYGKVLPVYQGAVGLLTEKAGHGRAGLGIEVSDEYTLTLRERVRHHFLTSMNYLESTSDWRRRQLERFARYFAESLNPDPELARGFIISANNDPALLAKAWDLLSTQGIEIEELRSSVKLNGLRDYRTGETGAVELPAGSWIIPTAQPMGRLANALFERETELSEEETYDITGWSLPVSFGLEAWEAMDEIQADTRPLTTWTEPAAETTGYGEVAIIIDANQHRLPAAVGALARHDVFARHTGGEIEIDGSAFGMGSLIIHYERNRQRDLDAFLEELKTLGVRAHRVETGMTTRGRVLGANDNWLFTHPKTLVVRGNPTSSYSYGQLWWYLDQEARLPHTSVNADALRTVDLSEFNVIVLPQVWGSLERVAGGNVMEELKEWTREGGTLVAIGSAARWATEHIGGVKEEPDEEKEGESDERPPLSELTWEERRQRGVDDNMPGPMLGAEVDTTHPLSAGSREWVGVIKRGGATLPVHEDGAVVARFFEDPKIGGHISERNRDRIGGTPFMTHHSVGRGDLVCVSDDVTIRGFMHGPMRLVLNAIVFGGSI